MQVPLLLDKQQFLEIFDPLTHDSSNVTGIITPSHANQETEDYVSHEQNAVARL